MATDSNSRSTTWNDKITNPRGRKLEDFVASIHLHVINEDNERTTFQSSRGKSKIDLTITNIQMLRDIKIWELSEEESASDHNIIKFSIRQDKHTAHENNFSEPRYRIKEHQLPKFYDKLYYNIAKTFQMEEKGRNTEEIELNSQVNESTDIRQFTVKLEEVIQTTYREICRQKVHQTQKQKERHYLVDGNTKDNEKKDKCSEKTIPTDDKQ